METSSDKEALKKNADFEILGINAIQQSSKLARQGDYKKAQVAAKAWDNVMNAAPALLSAPQQMQAQNFRSNINSTYSMINKQQQMIQQQPQQFMPMQPQQQMYLGSAQKPMPQMQMRGQGVSDAMSQQLYQNSRINTKKYSKQA